VVGGGSAHGWVFRGRMDDVSMQRATCRRWLWGGEAWQRPHSMEEPPSGPLATACRCRDALKASMEEALRQTSGMDMTK
jgi:hypothetical protein